jgi:hypothetical protein
LSSLLPHQNINEDDLPLSEWLKQNGIRKSDHLRGTDNFIHADDDLITSGIPTETILNKEDSDEDNVEFVEDTISSKSNLLTSSGCCGDFN